jgi:vanillate O-demethylase ferredoxin subunit
LRVGEVVSISRPKNSFRLDETAEYTILIAGGIGITPILCMLRRLARIGANWTLYFAARSRTAAAFLRDLQALDGKGGKIIPHFDDEAGGFLNIADIVRKAPADAHFYCCGPVPMLNAFKAATSALAPEFVHFEYFSAQEDAAREGGFKVVLARQKRSLFVPPGKTILEVLIHEKVNVAFSCSDGVCGTCETRVLEGVPDHRDSFLTDDEKARNATIMICCSGSRTSKLVLDL